MTGIERTALSLRFEGHHSALVEEPRTEAARILREAADKIEAGHDNANIRDMNGNTVGFWSIELTPSEHEP